MNICPQCNAELKPGAKFCHVCGYQIPEQPAEQPKETPIEQQPEPPQNVQEPVQPQNQPQNQTTNVNQNIMENQNVNNSSTPTGGMVQRIINMITKPKQEFDVIVNEKADVPKLLTTYAIPLMLIPAVSTIIGLGLIGKKVGIGIWSANFKSWQWGLSTGITAFVGSLISLYLVALIIDMLAPSFNSEKNFGKSFQLAVYSWTPVWVAGIFNIIPALSFIAGLAGIWGLVLLYMGIAPLKKTPADKVTVYFIISLLVAIVVSVVVGLVLGLIATAIYNPFSLRGMGGFGF